MTGTIDRPDSVGTQGDGAELARRPPNGGNPKSVSRRRALRMMGTAAVGAAGAVALNGARPSAVEAATGNNFILGQTNDADGDFTSLTSSNGFQALSVEATAAGATAVLGQATNAGGGVGVQGLSVNGTGVYGQHSSSVAPGVGVAGYSNMGPGVLGSSAAGAGLSGLSTAGRGVIGTGTVAGVRGEGGTSGIGVEGIGTGSAGVSGQSANGVGVSGETAGLLAVHAGVRGRAAPLLSGPNAPYPTPIGGNGNAGVQGLSGDGIGVLGMSATNKAGVRGIAVGSGPGVQGESGTGTGGGFESGSGSGLIGTSGNNGSDPLVAGVRAVNVEGGTALRVTGPASFEGPQPDTRNGDAIYATRSGSGNGSAIRARKTGSGPAPALLAESLTSASAPAAEINRANGSGPALSVTRNLPGAGPAILASREDLGVALVVTGQSQFSTAGMGKTLQGVNYSNAIAAGLTDKSVVMVTLLENPGGTRVVQWVEKIGASFVVHLTSAPPNFRPATPFAYFVVEAP